MKRLVVWACGAPLALIALLLSVANREPVTVSLDPFSLDQPAVAFQAPLFLLLFAAVFAGLLLGWLVAWSGHMRRERRARRTREASPGSGTTALVPRA